VGFNVKKKEFFMLADHCIIADASAVKSIITAFHPRQRTEIWCESFSTPTRPIASRPAAALAFSTATAITRTGRSSLRSLI
jgi:hypothetical protein